MLVSLLTINAARCKLPVDMNTEALPEELLEQQRKAGRARMAKLTHTQRVAFGKEAWAKRLRRYQQTAILTVSGRTKPQ